MKVIIQRVSRASVEINSSVYSSIDSGMVVFLGIKKGDKILFGKWSGTEVKMNGEDYLIMKESDIMGIISQTRKNKK